MIEDEEGVFAPWWLNSSSVSPGSSTRGRGDEEVSSYEELPQLLDLCWLHGFPGEQRFVFTEFYLPWASYRLWWPLQWETMLHMLCTPCLETHLPKEKIMQKLQKKWKFLWSFGRPGGWITVHVATRAIKIWDSAHCTLMRWTIKNIPYPDNQSFFMMQGFVRLPLNR